MYKNVGFTLIELLVAVLIIGILAAVALPQYQAAVAKSRLAAVMPLAKALKDSAEQYYLAHGAYPSYEIEELDFDWPESKKIGQGLLRKADVAVQYLSAGRAGRKDVAVFTLSGDTIINAYGFYLDFSDQPGLVYCGAYTMNKAANNVCKSLGGKNPQLRRCTEEGLDFTTCYIYTLP